ncbi:MAG: mechanosensitive ion channel [Alphaproteobacteria bacterium]|nr:mechanosensitive ion channel [Alphaproteobacteria bacterium]
MMLSRLLFIPLVMLIALSPSTGAAQSVFPSEDATSAIPALTDEQLTPETISDMVSRLSDEEVRALLLQRLGAVAAAKAAEADGGGSLLTFLPNAAAGIGEAVAISVRRLPDLWSGQTQSIKTFVSTYGAQGIMRLLGTLLAAILAGLAAEWLVNRLANTWRAEVETRKAPEGLGEALRLLGLRLLLDIIGLVVFALVARTVVINLLPSEEIRVGQIVMINLIMVPRLMAAMSRFFLAPTRPDLRIVHTDDDTARFIHRHWIGLGILIGVGAFVSAFNRMNGVLPGELRIGFWFNLAVHIYIAFIAIKGRGGLAKMLIGPEEDTTPMERRAARAYPWFLVAVSVVTWLIVEFIVSLERFDLLAGGRHYITMGIMMMAPAMDTMIRGLVGHLLPAMTGEGPIAERAYDASKRCCIRVGRTLVFGVVVLVIAMLWQVDFHNLASQGVGVRAAAALIEFLLVLAIGYLIWELVTLWVNQKLAAEQTALGVDPNDEEPGGGEGGGQGGSRLSTVLPLLRRILQSAIAVIAVLVALGSLNVDITPLLAGAGIVGLAIGFGAQKLVTDVVSGAFFLIDDAFRQGEYVDVEGTVGTVEKISIRSLQLRHHRGAVHTIPYGEIPKVTNYSRDWVIMKLRFTVPFDTDVNKIKKIFKKIGAEMMEVPEFAADMMQTFKSQGVLEVDDVGIVVRGKFMAKPGKQFTLRKEIYQRVKAEFEANGIQFARKEVRVSVPGIENGDLTQEDREVIAAAAADAAEKELAAPEGEK